MTQSVYVLYLFSVILGVVIYTSVRLFASLFDW